MLVDDPLASGNVSTDRPRPSEPLVFHSSKSAALATIVGSFMVPIIGLRVLLAGISALYGRVVVDSYGVSKLPTSFWGGFRAAWDEIESWEDGPDNIYDPDSKRRVRLRLRGRRKPVRVTEHCAHQPDFQKFVDVLTATLGEPTSM
jgi:hypothetical protein